MSTKFVLFIGDSEQALSFAKKDEVVEVAVNFEQTPSVGVLAELDADLAQPRTEKARKQGFKAGVYDSCDKGVLWLHKVLNIRE